MMRNLVRCNAQLLAGIATWAVVSGVVLFFIFQDPLTFMATLEPTIALLLVFGVCMTGVDIQGWSLRTRRILHGIMLAATVALGLLLPIDFLQIFSIIWLAMVPGLYSWRLGTVLVPVLGVMWWLILTRRWSDSGALVSVSLFGTAHLFLLFAARATVVAEQARDRTQVLYRELVATQHLLSEASRQSERTRIARDLHDLVGHHLTALSIHLQIAERQTQGEARERIAQSRGLARLLLADVREAVSSLRDQGALDLKRSLELLVDNVPQLDISLEVEDSVAVEDVDVADAIIRCVQEAITNSMRHSEASHGWIRVWQDRAGVHVEVVDDGGGDATAITEGNGLTGMRERLQAVGGSLDVAASDTGLRLRADIPVAA